MITVETANFKASLDKWVAEAKGRTRALAVEFIQDLNEAVVRATPVDTGFLRGSWYASVAGPAAKGGPVDPGGTASVARMNLVAAQVKLGDTYWATNGAAYAVHVEFGTSRMAPRAFVRATLARADSIAEAAARRVGSGA